MSNASDLNGANLLTHSRMACAKRCLREHFFKYELGVRRAREATALRFGAAFHESLDRLAKGETIEAVVRSIHGVYSVCPPWVTTDDDAYDWAIEGEVLTRLVCGYQWRWQNEHVEIVSSEQAFDLPLINPETGHASTVWRRAGKIDKIIRLADGRLAIMEHKATGVDVAPESDYWRRLRIDQQISHYVLAARAMGHDVATVIYDVVRKPTIRPSQVPLLDTDGCKIVLDASGERVRTKDGKRWRESGDTAQGFVLQVRMETPEEYGNRLTADIGVRPEHYYARMEIPRLEADLDEFAEELWQIQKTLQETRRTGRHFRNTAACVGFGRCDYFEVCTSGVDLTGPLPDGFVRIDDLHPELVSGEAMS